MSLFKDNLLLKAFGLFKVPMIYFTQASVVELSSQRIEIKIPLSWRTKNHLNSMYFGALCVGADCAGGLLAMKLVHEKKAKVGLVFKDFQAQFLKRPESDVHFHCEQGAEITQFIDKVLNSTERMNLPVDVIATTPKISGSEPVAKFVLTLSVKKKS